MNYFRFFLALISCMPLVQSMQAPKSNWKKFFYTIKPQSPQSYLQLLPASLDAELMKFVKFSTTSASAYKLLYDKNGGMLPADIYREFCKFTCQDQCDPAIVYWFLKVYQDQNTWPAVLYRTDIRVSTLELDEEHQKLFVGLESGRILIINIQTGACEQEINAFGNSIDQLLFNKNNNTLISTGAGLDNQVKIWDLNTGTCSTIHPAGNEPGIFCILDSKKNQLITTSGGLISNVIEIWDLNTLERWDILPPADQCIGLEVEDNGLFIYKTDLKNSEVSLYNTHSKTTTILFKENHFMANFKILKSCNKCIASFKINKFYQPIHNQIKIWDIKLGQFISTFKIGIADLRKFSHCINEKRNLLAVPDTEEITLWNFTVCRPFLRLKAPRYTIFLQSIFETNRNRLIVVQNTKGTHEYRIVMHDFDNSELKKVFENNVDAIRLAQLTFDAYLKNEKVDLRDDQRLYSTFIYLPFVLQNSMRPLVILPGQESWTEKLLGNANK